MAVGVMVKFTVTTANVGAQDPLLMVHWYTYIPYKEAVAADKPDAGELKAVVPGPEIWLHNPDPSTGVLPPSEPLVRVPQ